MMANFENTRLYHMKYLHLVFSGILLTRTRANTRYLIQFIKDQENLKGLIIPGRIVGQGQEHKGAITDKEQMKVLSKFREGKVNTLSIQ